MKKILIFALIGMVGIFASPALAIICDNDVCGDANGDGLVNILDVNLMIDFYYCYENGIEYCEEVEEIICEDNIDVDGTPGFMYSDITYLINYLYRNGPDLDCGF